MPDFQYYRASIGIPDTSGGYTNKTNLSGRNDKRLTFDYIDIEPENCTLMLPIGGTPIG